MKKAKINKGDIFGQWTIERELSRGGNGAVYLAKNKGGEKVAIKFLHVFGRGQQVARYQRFKDEVKVIQENIATGGILPIFDYNLPNELKNEHAWYSMPLATPLSDFLKGKYTEDKVRVILQIAKTLSVLHSKGISHRDIKPPNILVRDDNIFLADFGLADYPEKTELTRDGEGVGARWTIAPEMQRESTLAEGKAADIYSLAKTLWILLTGKETGFEGQYNPESINALHNFSLLERPQTDYYEPNRIRFTIILDDLLKKSTDDNPSARPTINEFLGNLEWWLETYKNLQLYNALELQYVHEKLFPFAVPEKAIWEDQESIAKVLNFIGGIRSLNHMMIPSGGGIDLTCARMGNEKGTIELNYEYGSIIYIVKPKRLSLYKISEDLSWSYFLIETGGLEPIGFKETSETKEEYAYSEVVQLANAKYIALNHWFTHEYEGSPLPKDARRVMRYLKGRFLIVQKTSIYNRMNSTYDARHAKVSIARFENYMQNLANLTKEIMGKPEFQRFVSTDLKDKDASERISIIGETIASFIEKKVANL